MHNSTLDLFCNNEDDQFDIDSAFVSALEECASKLEVTVDYYIEEFLLWQLARCPLIPPRGPKSCILKESRIWFIYDSSSSSGLLHFHQASCLVQRHSLYVCCWFCQARKIVCLSHTYCSHWFFSSCVSFLSPSLFSWVPIWQWI